MFWRKKKKINHLLYLLHLKEKERKMIKDAAQENKKLLAEALRKNNELLRKYQKLERKFFSVIEVEDNLRAEIENRKKLYARGKEISGIKIRNLVVKNNMLKANNEALSCNVIQEQFENAQRQKNEIALSSRLEAFERILGKIDGGDGEKPEEQENKNDDDILSQEEIPREDAGGIAEADAV